MTQGIRLDDIRYEIEEQYKSLCKHACVGGAATIDELVDVVGIMSKMMQVVDELARPIIRLQDQALPAPPTGDAPHKEKP